MFTIDNVCLVVIDVQGKLATIVDESEADDSTNFKACSSDECT